MCKALNRGGVKRVLETHQLPHRAKTAPAPGVPENTSHCEPHCGGETWSPKPGRQPSEKMCLHCYGAWVQGTNKCMLWTRRQPGGHGTLPGGDEDRGQEVANAIAQLQHHLRAARTWVPLTPKSWATLPRQLRSGPRWMSQTWHAPI